MNMFLANLLSPKEFFESPMFGDKISLYTVLVSLVVSVAAFIICVANLKPGVATVPTHYLNFVGFDEVGPWYSYLSLGLFPAFITIMNTVLAVSAFARSRLASFFLLTGAAATSIICLITLIRFVTL